MATPQELVACIDRLASLPAVYHRIRNLLDDPDSSVLELTEAVSGDPALTARVLRVVNSAMYGFPGKIETVGRAVNLMGMQQVHDLVLSTAVVGAFRDIRPAHLPMVRFWKDCVFRALAARAAAQQLGMGNPERLFVEGLLADIGHLVMFQAAPEAGHAAREHARQSGLPLHEVEQALVGCDYAEVGAALASSWQLPGGFASVIGAQLMPALAGPHATEASLVNVANQILASEGEEAPDEAALSRLDPMTSARLEMDAARIAAIRSQAGEQTPGVIALFFPDQG